MKSYKPEELFDDTGKLQSDIAEVAPTGSRRMGATHTPMAVSCSKT